MSKHFDFEFASGSVIGRDHRIPGKNRQDSCCVRSEADISVAICTDGCGSSPNSEVGAQLWAKMTADAVLKAFNASDDPDWSQIQADLLTKMDTLISLIGGSRTKAVNDFLLFTIVGAVITPAWSVFFSFGDGFMVVNGTQIRLGPFPDNTPPYLAYCLAQTSLNPNLLRFQIHRRISTSELEHFLIGTDGVEDLARAEGKTFPGKLNLVGPISSLWTDDRFFNNADMVRRHLVLVNGGSKPALMGYLIDDTTLISGRRRKEVNNA